MEIKKQKQLAREFAQGDIWQPIYFFAGAQGIVPEVKSVVVKQSTLSFTLTIVSSVPQLTLGTCYFSHSDKPEKFLCLLFFAGPIPSPYFHMNVPVTIPQEALLDKRLQDFHDLEREVDWDMYIEEDVLREINLQWYNGQFPAYNPKEEIDTLSGLTHWNWKKDYFFELGTIEDVQYFRNILQQNWWTAEFKRITGLNQWDYKQ